MSSIYYNNRWKEAINDLIENLHEEFEPLDENLNEKGVIFKHIVAQILKKRLRVVPILCSSVCQICPLL